MALEQKLSLKLQQKLVMTPSLQQAIKLLQMNRLELEGVLTQELVENPILEEREVVEERSESEDERAENEDPMADIDLEAYFGEYMEGQGASGQALTYEERQGPPLENTLTREPDLYDHLLWQLHMMDISAELREIAELIIGNLDHEGFLAATVEEIMAMGASEELQAEMLGAPAIGNEESPVDTATVDTAAVDTAAEDASSSEDAVLAAAAVSNDEAPAETASRKKKKKKVEAAPEPAQLDPEDVARLAEHGYSRDLVEEALTLVRNLEPAGVACRDLQESLLHQLDARQVETSSLVRRVIAEKWALLKKRKFEQIARDFDIPLADLQPVVEEIRHLETRPGRGFDTERTYYVEPDVQVVKVGEEYVVQLNDDGLPRLRVSRAYRRMLQTMRREGRQADAQAYIKEKMRSAMWLIKSLDQRQRTIYKVASSIVKQQQAFLDYGIDHLRPMVLRDVAEDIEMHESTVSRVVSNKYIHTPRGLFPMKFFFHSGIDREYGGDISSLTVKRKISHLVQDEDQRKPLSDSELMRILNREGIQIARRTVAKYRDELGIPSSTERKQIF
ncbi:MAG: RNA polymerase factor sigma-54 [Acidobacteriota bacterium]